MAPSPLLPSHSLQHFLGPAVRAGTCEPAPAIVKLSETDTTRHYPILSSGASRAGHSDIILDQTQHQ